MLPAGTRPILEHVFNALIDAGVYDIHLLTVSTDSEMYIDDSAHIQPDNARQSSGRRQ